MPPKKSTRVVVPPPDDDNEDHLRQGGGNFKLMGDIILQAAALPSEKIDEDIEQFSAYADMADWRGISLYFDSLSSMCQLASQYDNWGTRFRVAEYLISCFGGLKDELTQYVMNFFEAREGNSEHVVDAKLVDTLGMFVVLAEKLTVQLQRYVNQVAASKASNQARGRGGKTRNAEMEDEIHSWKSTQRFRMINCLTEILDFKVDTISGSRDKALRYVFAPERIEGLFMERFLTTVTQLYEDQENASRGSQTWLLHYLRIGMSLSSDWKLATQFADSLFTKTLQLSYLDTANNYPFIEPLVTLMREEKENEMRKNAMRNVLTMIVRRACLLYDDDRSERLPLRAYCLLLQSLAVNVHDIMLQEAHLVYRLLHNPHQNVRMAALQCLSDMFCSPYLSQQQCEKFSTRHEKRRAIFEKIVAHVNDEGTHVRSKALSLLRGLIENRRIPEQFESYGFLSPVGGRLLDKSVQVRKCAMQCLTVFLDKNQHGHDFNRDTHVTLLDTKARDLRLKSDANSRIMQEVTDYFISISFELRSNVKKELTTLFKGELGPYNEKIELTRLYEDLEKRENAAAIARFYANRHDFPYPEKERKKHANNALHLIDEAVKYVLAVTENEYRTCKVQQMLFDHDQVIEEEQLKKDAQHTMMQQRAQVQQLINKMCIEKELAKCTQLAVRCVMMGETAEIKEGIRFLTRCKQFGITGADEAIRSMCSLVWRPSQDVIEELIEAAEDMFISKLEGGDKASDRDKSTVEQLMSAMKDVSERDRSSVEEVIYLLAAPEREHKTDDKNSKNARKRRPIEPNVISRLWNIALDTSHGNEERKMIALRVLYPISRTEKGILEARGRLRSIQKKLVEGPKIAVEALRIISILGTPTQLEKQDDAYSRPIFRINPDDSLFKSIEQLFFHEVVKANDEVNRDWYSIIRLTISSILNVSMDVNLMLPKLAAHFLYRAKRISEFCFYYTKLVDETDDDVKKEVASRRRDYWSMTWCRVMEKLMAFCGEVAVQLNAYIQVTLPRLHCRYVKKIVNAEKNSSTVREVQPRLLSDIEKSISIRKSIFAISEEATPENPSNDLHHLVSQMSEKRLFQPKKLLGRLLPIVVYGMRTKTMPLRIKQAAIVAFGKFMPLSAEISSFGAPMFFSTMVRSSSQLIRCNQIAACCDFAFAQPTLFELYAPSLFRMSRDKSDLARESTILVLSHLMSNDMIQTRGALSEPARCICDNNRYVAEAAQSFFRDLNARSDVLVQLLPEFVYRLASPGERIPYKYYKIVFEFLIQLLKDKAKSNSDSLIDRVCMKFSNIDMNDTEAPKYLLIALLKFVNNDGGLRRLQENWRHWSKFLCHSAVSKEYISMIEHMHNTSKCEDYKSQCSELIANIKKIQEEGLSKEDIAAPPTTSKGRGRKPAAPRGSSPGPSKRNTRGRRKPARGKSESSDDEEEEKEEEEEEEEEMEIEEEVAESGEESD